MPKPVRQADWDVIVVGSGNAGLCAGIAAAAGGARVLMLDKADARMAGGNSKYTAGAMRFAYNSSGDLMPLLREPDDPRILLSDFGSYTEENFVADLLRFNEGLDLSREQRILVGESYATMLWLAGRDVRFEPIYERQSFQRNGRYAFWGGVTLEAQGEGVGLVAAELAAFRRLGGTLRCETPVTGLVVSDGGVVEGVEVDGPNGPETILAHAVVLASGGFEADAAWRVRDLGPDWARAKVRGTPCNTGDGLRLALDLGARSRGRYDECHATPMDLHMPDYGNLDLPHLERKNYRKICYFLGVMVNADGERFVDEGRDFRNYTYAQFGRAVLQQRNGMAWQIFDAKVLPLLYEEYRFHGAHFVEAETLDGLLARLDGLNRPVAAATLAAYNAAVDEDTDFDPSKKDGKTTRGLALPKSNWAQRLDAPPYRAYPVTGGITFTYGGLEVDDAGAVIHQSGAPIPGLFACGELVGGVFFRGYPGGSGLTSGAVFGRRAGTGAAAFVRQAST